MLDKNHPPIELLCEARLQLLMKLHKVDRKNAHKQVFKPTQA